MTFRLATDEASLGVVIAQRLRLTNDLLTEQSSLLTLHTFTVKQRRPAALTLGYSSIVR
jgi:hypothetical protein